MDAIAKYSRYGTMLSGFNPRARDGRDIDGLDGAKGDQGFNPRARDGRDAITDQEKHELIKVSIHAPVMDAIKFNKV